MPQRIKNIESGIDFDFDQKEMDDLLKKKAILDAGVTSALSAAIPYRRH